jgi:hypothetical protein
MAGDETKFGKSRSNRRVENSGLALLLEDPRFQAPDRATKLRILESLPVRGNFGIQTFDAVMSRVPVDPLSTQTVDQHVDRLRLVEMKTTRKPIRDQALNGFFFGATEREYEMARALGDRYLFAFVVLSADNLFGRPFFVLLTLDEVEHRTRSKRIQYQVNFRSDIVLDPDAPGEAGPLEFRAAEDVARYGSDVDVAEQPDRTS